MSDETEVPALPGHLPIKEAAKILGVQERRVYRYIEAGKLKAFRAGNVFVIPVEELELFQHHLSGRPRKNTPAWHVAAGKSVWLQVFVHLRPGQQKAFEQKLAEVRVSGEHIFPGTAARYIALSEERPGEVQILLVWRGSKVASSETHEKELADLRKELAEVVDWEGARYEHGQILMHT